MSYYLKPCKSSCFFIDMNVKEFKQKKPFDEIFNLSFDLGPLKVSTYCIRRICKGLSKGLI